LATDMVGQDNGTSLPTTGNGVSTGMDHTHQVERLELLASSIQKEIAFKNKCIAAEQMTASGSPLLKYLGFADVYDTADAFLTLCNKVIEHPLSSPSDIRYHQQKRNEARITMQQTTALLTQIKTTLPPAELEYLNNKTKVRDVSPTNSTNGSNDAMDGSQTSDNCQAGIPKSAVTDIASGFPTPDRVSEGTKKGGSDRQ